MRRYLVLTCLLALTGCGTGDNNSNPPTNNATTGDDVGTTTPSQDMGASDDADGADDGTTEADTGGPVVELPAWDELEDGWNEIYPGGDTACALGQEWSFYVYKGDPTKLTVHYFGGGACWNSGTCAGDVYTDDLSSLRAQIDAGGRPGIFDMENAENPVNGWSQIVVPYCTGDVHWGDNIVEYGVGNVIHHKGAVNAQTVYDFADREMPDVEEVFVHGCSAGAYGAIMWAPYFMQRYPGATQTVFADSGAGVITDDFFTNSFPNWNPNGVFPSWIPALDPTQVDVFSLTTTDLYREIGTAYPDAILSQWNTQFDETQTLFYTLMGGMGDAAAWSTRMYALTHGIVDSTPNYRNWTADGAQHCTLPLNRFYSHETNGVKLTDWLSDMLSREAIDNVACANCETP